MRYCIDQRLVKGKSSKGDAVTGGGRAFTVRTPSVELIGAELGGSAKVDPAWLEEENRIRHWQTCLASRGRPPQPRRDEDSSWPQN